MENNYPGASNIKRTQMLTQKERGFLKVLLLTACLSKSTSCNPHVGQLEITKGEQNRFQKKWQISQHNLWRNRYDARHPSFVKRWNETNQMLWDIFLQNMLFRVSYYFVIFNNTVNRLLVHTSNKEPELVFTSRESEPNGICKECHEITNEQRAFFRFSAEESHEGRHSSKCENRQGRPRCLFLSRLEARHALLFDWLRSLLSSSLIG